MSLLRRSRLLSEAAKPKSSRQCKLTEVRKLHYPLLKIILKVFADALRDVMRFSGTAYRIDVQNGKLDVKAVYGTG